MIPIGGFSVLIHLMVNVLAYAGKFLPRTGRLLGLSFVPAPLIALTLIGIISYFAGSLFWEALHTQQQFDIVTVLRNL